ncbi:MAG: phage N-6-adenine-methyltransferase [Polyangiaceae bacterium]|nr:phage N-6-adenine-methyltransferase [Polyangiaceae bacterium]
MKLGADMMFVEVQTQHGWAPLWLATHGCLSDLYELAQVVSPGASIRVWHDSDSAKPLAQWSKPRSGASLNRHRSEQDVETPPELIAAVERRFGPIETDLAATKENKKGPFFVTPEEDSLSLDWDKVVSHHIAWLNPPYGNIAPWARKCAEYQGEGRIALLVPASVGSEWYARYVDGRALVLSLRPRVKFVGHKQPFPKDLILAVYGEKPGFEPWRWDDDGAVEKLECGAQHHDVYKRPRVRALCTHEERTRP